MPFPDSKLINADVLQPADVRAVVSAVQIPFLDVLHRIPGYTKQGRRILDGHDGGQLTDISFELVGVSAFAGGEGDVFVLLFSTIFAFEAEYSLYQNDRLGTDGYTTELSLCLTVMYDMPAAAVRTTEFVLSRFDFKLNHVIFVSCSGALLVS